MLKAYHFKSLVEKDYLQDYPMAEIFQGNPITKITPYGKDVYMGAKKSGQIHQSL